MKTILLSIIALTGLAFAIDRPLTRDPFKPDLICRPEIREPYMPEFDEPCTIPEPATMMLLGAGVVLMRKQGE